MQRIKYLILSVLATFCLGANAYGNEVQKDELQKLQILKGMNEALSKEVTFTADPEASCDKGCKKHHRKRKCGDCGCARPITARDIRRGFVIDRPGTYRLEENVEFFPGGNLNAIVIDADNVVLDLCNHVLSLGNEAPGVNGILVNGRDNVVIENGTVTDFSLFGIRATSGTSFLTIRNVDVLRNGVNDPTALTISGGIVLTSGEEAIHDVLIIDVNSSENSLAGLILHGVDNVDIVHSRFNSNTGAVTPFGNNVWGILATAFLTEAPPIPVVFPTSNIRIIESEANGNIGAGGAIGIEILSVPAFGFPINDNISIVRVTANDNQGGGAESPVVNEGEGIVIAGTQNFVVRECVAQGNHTLATEPTGIPGFFASVGFGVPFGSNNGLFEDCVAEGNSGPGDISAGFRFLRSSNITVNNCVAIGNNNSSTGEAWGFTTDPLVGNDFGAFGAPFNTNFLITNSVAEGNVSNGGIGGGFKYISQINSVLAHNHSVGNGSVNGTGYGILVGNPTCCATSTCCTADPVICDSPSGCLPFASCCPSSHNVINNNEVVGNSDFGIVDNIVAPDTALNAYFANVARGNGTNYQIPLGNPIRTWTLPGYPAVVDNNTTPVLDTLDNIDINP